MWSIRRLGIYLALRGLLLKRRCVSRPWTLLIPCSSGGLGNLTLTTLSTRNGGVFSLVRPCSGSKNVEIIIGYAEKQPTKILEASPEDLPEIDQRLRKEADDIAANLHRMREPLNRAIKSAPRLSADGFTVIEADTGDVRDWGYWLPTFLPDGKAIPSPGRRLVLNGPIVDLEQVDTNGRLVAVSLAYLGDLRWLCVVAIAIFVSSTLVARFLSRKFLRSYFLYSQTRVPTLEEALRQGEGTQVEFKRALSDDEGRDGRCRGGVPEDCGRIR